MRIFVLQPLFNHLQRAVVRINNAGLPDDLERMSMYSRKVEIISLDGKKVDSRVCKVKSESANVGSKYYEKCLNLSYGH